MRSPTLLAAIGVTLALSAPLAQSKPPTASHDPLTLFRPTVVTTERERQQLSRDEPIARVLPAEGEQVAVFAAIPMRVDGDRLVHWVRDIAAFKANRHVVAIARFSDPPRLEDLDALTLDTQDLDALRECRPGACELKLTADEIAALQRVAKTPAGRTSDDLTRAFRDVVLHRVRQYLRGGLSSLPPLAARRQGVSLSGAFNELVEQNQFLTRGMPRLADALLDRVPARDSDLESFLYWSKERISGKPIISVTHVLIARHDDGVRPDVIVAGKGIFATHYLNGSLGVTALVRGSEGVNYFVYVNRSRVDLVQGFFGGVVRRVMERRLRSEVTDLLRGLRTRLQTGLPATNR